MEKLLRWSWVFGVLGGFCLLIFGSMWWVSDQVTPTAAGIALLGAALLVAYAALDREVIGEGASSTAVINGASSVLIIAVAFTIALFSVRVAREHDQRWDFTEAGAYTLSQNTQEVLAGLNKDVQIYGIFRRATPERTEFKRLIEGYRLASSRVQVELIDPLLQKPRALAVSGGDGTDAEAYGTVSEYGSVLIQVGARTERVEVRFDETSLTNSIIRAISDKDHKICWATGHGELDPDADQGPGGIGGLVLMLEDKNYTVSLTRTLTDGVDPTCSALVIARPLRDWSTPELDALHGFLGQGGGVLALLDTPLDGPDTPTLDAALGRYGVLLGRDVVIETDPNNLYPTQDAGVFYVFDRAQLGIHKITQGLRDGVLMGLARSVRGETDRDGVTVRELVSTSRESWAETDFSAAEPRPDTESMGPISLIVTAEVTDPAIFSEGLTTPSPEGEQATNTRAPSSPQSGGRLIVIGDTDFALNQLVGTLNNRDLFLNSVAWLAGEDSQLGETPELTDETLIVTNGQLQVLALILILLPLVAIVLAVSILLRRRML